MINLQDEIVFQTTRSGGKGGQNVNKVETAVIGAFAIAASGLLTGEQKALLLQKLASRINADGFIKIKSQTHRSQLANKEEVIERINELITQGLKRKKARIATMPGKGSIQNRIESKKRKSEVKVNRQKYRPGNDH